ncbi:MAG: 30S ribosomal protein S2 [Limnothrix sp.]
MPVVSLAELLECGVHFGHQTRRWNPKMAPYIYTSRNGVHIIDLVQTAQLVQQAYTYMKEASESGKRVLFVGTKRQAAAIIAQEAKRCGAFYINQRWLGGMLTNWETIKTRVERLKELEALQDSGNLDRRPKKEASMLRRELDKLQKYLGGIKNMRKIPDIVVVIDQRREHNAIQECQKLNIPIVSLLDTNCDPQTVDMPIPANDDAIRSIKLIVGTLADAIYSGRHGESAQSEDYEEFEEAIEAAGAVEVVEEEEVAAEEVAVAEEVSVAEEVAVAEEVVEPEEAAVAEEVVAASTDASAPESE